MIRTLVFYLLFSVSYATTCSQLKTLYSDLTCCGNPTVDTCLRTIPLCASAANGEICTDTSDHAIIKGGVSATIPTASTTVLGGVKVDGSSIIIADGIISAPIGSSSSSTTAFSGDYDDLTNKPAITATLAGVLQIDNNNLGLGISPTAPLHVGTGESTSISASRFECDGIGAIVTQTTGEISGVMTQTDCSALANYQSTAPALSATKEDDAKCLSVSNSPYNYNVVEVNSGTADESMTAKECELWAVANNKNWVPPDTWPTQAPPGCWIHTGNVRFNTVSTTISCGVGYGGNPVICLQKLNVNQQTSGDPTNDIAEPECKGYAASVGLSYESVAVRSELLPIGSTHIIGSGYSSYSVSSASTCTTMCAQQGFSYSSYATNSVRCRCANSEGNPHSYGYGTGVYKIEPQPSGCYKEGDKIWHTSLTTSIHCDGTKICLRKATTFDNPGSTDQGRVDACRDACVDRSKALFSGSWGFRSASFWVEPTGGECFCGADSATTCAKEASTLYDLYELKNPPQGCFKDSSGNHYHNNPSDDNYGACSPTYTCLRNDQGCLVQDTATESKELSMISEKSAWFKQEVVISSDRRIKENITDIVGARATMRQIPARRYGYIDKRKWNGTTVGFIAQEVKEVMPEAVKVEKGFVPNILKRVQCTYAYNITLRMTCDELNSGRVRLFVTDEGGESLLDVEVNDGVMEVEKVYIQVYAFGYEVENIHTLEKSKLFALNFAATKEIDADVEALKEQINALMDRVNVLERV